MFLTWHEPISCELLVADMLLLLAVAGMAGLLAWHLDTLVVRSAAFYLSALPDHPHLPTGLQVFCQGIHLLPCLGPELRSWTVCSDPLSGPAVYLCTLACGMDALPTREYQHFPQLVMLDCPELSSLGFMLPFIYNGFLSISTSACSYMGKDLPENYKAKRVTFSLLLNVVSWIALFTTANVY